MNQTIEDFTRAELKKLIVQCTEGEQFMFKRTYSHKNLDLPIEEAVDKMKVENLDNALSQVERTLNKKKRWKH